MVIEVVEIEVTRGLLHVLNGCAAVEAGQRVWLKVEPARGARVALDASEVRFVRSWVDESIKVAEEMAQSCTADAAIPTASSSFPSCASFTQCGPFCPSDAATVLG